MLPEGVSSDSARVAPAPLEELRSIALEGLFGSFVGALAASCGLEADSLPLGPARRAAMAPIVPSEPAADEGAADSGVPEACAEGLIGGLPEGNPAAGCSGTRTST